MPILLKSSLIALAEETENEAKKYIELGKANFFVDIREASVKNMAITPSSEGLLEI